MATVSTCYGCGRRWGSNADGLCRRCRGRGGEDGGLAALVFVFAVAFILAGLVYSIARQRFFFVRGKSDFTAIFACGAASGVTAYFSISTNFSA